jgi:hypothetical protein
MEAGLNEAAVGSALWAEYLGAPGATLMADGGLRFLGAPGDGCPGAGRGVGRPPDVIGRAVIDW